MTLSTRASVGFSGVSMRKLFLFGVLAICAGCGPSAPSEPGHPSNPIRAVALVETYRDFPDRAKKLYTHQMVVVRVTKGHYIVAGGEIRWYASGDRSREPSLIIVGRNDPAKLVPDADSDLLVTGHCGGRSYDGVDRGNDVRFTVRMTDCTLTAVNPPGDP